MTELSRISLLYGFHRYHLRKMVREHPDKFKYIETLYPGDLEKAYGMYVKEEYELKDALVELYYQEDFIAFCNDIYEEIGYRSGEGVLEALEKALFSIHAGFYTHSTFIKHKKIYTLFVQNP